MTNKIVNPFKYQKAGSIFKHRDVFNAAGEKIAVIEHDFDGWWFSDLTGKYRSRTHCFTYADAVAIAKDHKITGPDPLNPNCVLVDGVSHKIPPMLRDSTIEEIARYIRSWRRN